MTTILDLIPNPATLLKQSTPDMLGIHNHDAEGQILDLIEDGRGSPAWLEALSNLMREVPLFADPYIALAQEGYFPQNSIDLHKRASVAGKSYLEAKLGEDICWWHDRETRSYMRAQAGIALIHIRDGQIETGIAIIRNLLELNSDDNLGLRSEIIFALINEGRWDDLEETLHEYSFDGDVPALYARVFLDWLQEQIEDPQRYDFPRATASLRQAMTLNPIVPSAVGEPSSFTMPTDGLRMGGASEAAYFALKTEKTWKKHYKFSQWLSTSGLRLTSQALGFQR